MTATTGSTPAPARRRSLRDWSVDIALFLAAVGYGLAWTVPALDDPATSLPRLAANQALAAAACAALWLRRRWPVGLAVALVPVSTLFDLSAGAQLVALFTVAVHRPVRTTLVIGAAIVLARASFLGVFLAWRDWTHDVSPGWVLLFTVTTTLAAIGWGLVVRHRRELVASLRDRAARAESEARLRAEYAQHQAREQIAREMHDVLGHRLSLLSVHAGALEYRPDAPPEEVARAAGVIRETAHRALQDLREVIGVLRAPVGELPQPTFADARDLVADSDRAGMRVELHERVAGTVPDGTGRTAYRIIQEGLTNARKHAPGAEVTVTVAGAPGRGLTVEVTNTAPEPRGDAGSDGPGDGPPVPGAGQGLAGLAERVSLVGGRLEHGPTASGGFRLSAWLPWPATGPAREPERGESGPTEASQEGGAP